MKLIATAAACTGESCCPAVLELDNGDYLVIGKIPTQAQLDDLPQSVGIGPGEVTLALPRAVMRDAVLDLTTPSTTQPGRSPPSTPPSTSVPPNPVGLDRSESAPRDAVAEEKDRAADLADCRSAAGTAMRP
ncbi:hypothetical protein [Streptomyces sp. NPDC056663]|uniref:hypothetical protein n=1 Tax=Streptomyces sp. NPDC056663 TaxID=3345899 RepID=UPI0036800B12